jgi:cytoskeleton protein RodZ
MSEAGLQGAGTEGGPGQLLAHLRSQRNLSVADVAQRLKYGVRQIEALEAEEFGRLPGTTFVRGMIRGYAKLLEIDPVPVLKALERRNIPGEPTVDLRAKRVPFADGTKKRGTHIYLGLSAIALVGVLLVFYEWHAGGLMEFTKREVAAAKKAVRALAQGSQPQSSKSDTARRTVVAEEMNEMQELPAAPESAATPGPATKPNGAAAAPSASTKPSTASTAAAKPSIAAAHVAAAKPAPSAKPIVATSATSAPSVGEQGNALRPTGRIFLEFTEDSWVEITDGDGKTLMAQLNHGGSRRLISGQPPLSLVIGNASAVRVVYNDALIDLKPHVKVEVARLTLQ